MKQYVPSNVRIGKTQKKYFLIVRVKSFFPFKDKLPKMLLSGIFYKYKCGVSNAIYGGKTKRHFKVQICEHLGISHLTGKKAKIDNNMGDGGWGWGEGVHSGTQNAKTECTNFASPPGKF